MHSDELGPHQLPGTPTSPLVAALRELSRRASTHPDDPIYRAGLETAWDVAHEFLTTIGERHDEGRIDDAVDLMDPREVAAAVSERLRETVRLLHHGAQAGEEGPFGPSVAQAMEDGAGQLELIADAIEHLVATYVESDPPWQPQPTNDEVDRRFATWLVTYTVSGLLAGRDPDALANHVNEAAGHRPELMDLVRMQLTGLEDLDPITGERARRVTDALNSAAGTNHSGS